MTLRLIWHVAVLIAVFSFLPLCNVTVGGNDNFFIDGRVIDDLGKPIPYADVRLHPLSEQIVIKPRSEDVSDGLVIFEQADSEGRFRFSLEVKRFAICATYPSDKKDFAPLSLEYLCYGSNVKTYEVKKNENLFLGDLKAVHNNQKIELNLFDKKQRPFFGLTPLSTLQLRLSDEKYRIITTTKIPVNAIDQKTSAIKLLLPEGKWNVEFSLGQSTEKWSVPYPFNIISENNYNILKLNIVVRFPISENQLSATQAKAKLDSAGIEYSLDSFMNYASDGNEAIVELFLKSGFSPNTLFENKSSVVMGSSGFPRIVEMLLKAGANVNQKTDEGLTPLMSAIIKGNLKSVDLLLRAGADIEAQNNEGETPLMFAVEEDEIEIVKTLLQCGARKNTKNMAGKTALDIANEFGHEKAISILSKD